MLINLSETRDDLYDLMVKEMVYSGGFASGTGTTPTPLLTPEDINEDSVRRMAYLLLNGVRVYSGGGAWRVIGAGGEATPGPWDGQPLPRTAYLADDLRGHVEIHALRKVAYRRCSHCGDNFTQERPRSVTARWKELCSEECRRSKKVSDRRAARARARG